METTTTMSSKNKGRTPFQDLTNFRSHRSLKRKSISLSIPIADDTAVDTRGREDDVGDLAVEKCTPRSKESNNVEDELFGRRLEMSVTYTRCKASSCPPAERSRAIKGRKILVGASTPRQVASSVPCQKPQRKRRCNIKEAKDKLILPRDFIEKQQAYFSEVDAFELPVEEVSETELE